MTHRTHEIVRQVALLRGVPVAKLLGKSRAPALVKIRVECARRLRATGLSYPAIGRQLGGRHHATIMYYLGATKRGAWKLGRIWPREGNA